MPNLNDYASQDDALRDISNSPMFAKLPAPAQQSALQHTREMWAQLHGPKPKETPTVLPSAKAEATPDSGADFSGKMREKAIGGVAALEKKTGIPDPVGELAVKLLPSDNAQAFIDSFTIGSMMVAPELELGWATKAALTALAGGTGGAIQGGASGAVSGAGKGAVESVGGDILTGAVRGTGAVGRAGLTSGNINTGGEVVGSRFAGQKAIDKANQKGTFEDITRISDWLKNKFPTTFSKGMEDMEGWKETFNRGKWLNDATEELKTVAANTDRTLKAAGKRMSPEDALKPDSPATVFSPKAQDEAQDAALAKERTPDAKAAAAPGKPTVFAQKPNDPQAAYQKVKDLQAELKAAKAQKGSGMSYENKIRQTKIDEIKESLKVAQAEARAATKGGGKSGPIDLDAAVAESQRRAREAGLEFTKPGVAPVRRAADDTEPLVEIKGVPAEVADEMMISGKEKVGVKFSLANAMIDKVEKDGWALSGVMGHTDKAMAARSAAIQMEASVAESLAKINPEAAAKWQGARVQQRAARALTYILSAPGVTDAKGNIVMSALQKTVQGRGAFMDLEAALGPDEATSFIKMIGRGQTSAQDIPAKPFSTYTRVHFGVLPTFGFHFGKAGLRVNGAMGPAQLPFDLGADKALAMAMTLGPARLIQTLGDIIDWNNLPENQAVRRTKMLQSQDERAQPGM